MIPHTGERKHFDPDTEYIYTPGTVGKLYCFVNLCLIGATTRNNE